MNTTASSFWCSIDLKQLTKVLSTEAKQRPAFAEKGSISKTLIPAAVLFPIVCHKDHLSVILTQRTMELKDHPGQISFPGGRVDESDIDLMHTALREAEEEIALPSSKVQTLGYLPEYQTITGYSITPVMGLIKPPFNLSANPAEVKEIFEAPLEFLLNPKNHQQHKINRSGEQLSFYAIDYNGYFIWGATAGIIVYLSQRLQNLSNSK